MPNEPVRESPAHHPPLLPILSVNFVGALGYSIVLPFLVFLVTKWGGNAVVYGLMGATYSAFQLVGAPILGRWSDRYGRRRILLVSQLGTLVSWLVFLTAFFLPTSPIGEVDSGVLGRFSLTLPLIVMFVARAADGLTGGNVSVANAYLADVSDDTNRTENFGRMAVAGNLGFVLGPALAGILGATAHGEILPVVSALAISLLAALIIGFRLEETTCRDVSTDPERTGVGKVFGQEHKDCFRMRGEGTLSTRDVLAIPRVPVLLLIYFVVMLGFSLFYVAFPIHAAQALTWSVTETGVFFAVLSVLMVLAQGPVLERASKATSERTLTIVGAVLLAGGFAALSGGTTTSIYAAAALIALGNGLMWPSVMALLAAAAGERAQGAVQGFAGSAGAVASILGLLAGGLLYTRLAHLTFLASASLFALILLLSTRLPGPGSGRVGGEE